MNTIKDNSNKSKITLIITITLFIAISYIGLLNIAALNRPISTLDIIKFIKFFDIILAAFAALSCIVCYNSTKKEELFILSLLYIVFFVDISFGNIDAIDFKARYIEMNNYILIPTSLFRVAILIISVSSLNKVKRLIINNKIKAIILVIIIATSIGILKINGLISNGFTSINQFIIYNVFLFIVYVVSACVYLNKSIKTEEYIYAVISASIFLFSIKWIYAIVEVTSPSSYVKIVSISITYICFILFIGGVMLELILNIKKNKELENELIIFKKLADENKKCGIIIYNNNREIIYANDTAKIYWTYKKDIDYVNLKKEIIEKTKNIKIDKLKQIQNHILQVGFWSGSIKLDKSGVVLNCNMQRIHTSNGKNTSIIFKDVSNRVREKNALLEYEKIKGQEQVRNEFFANISHELRTPLNIFYSTVQLLDRKVNANDFKDVYINHKQSLKTNCQRMLRLINNIVDITKIDVGFTKAKFANIDIIRLVEDVTMSVLNYARHKNLNVVFDTNIEEHIIKCDPEMMERVILNLLSNAIKFTEKNGNIWIGIDVDSEYVHIIVKDDGIGIPIESQSTIFERFVQSDKSLTRLNEGSGIGLSIVHYIVTLNGGEIYLDSDGKNGTEFEIILPNIKEDKIYEADKEYKVDIQKIELELSDIYELYQ